MWLPQGCCFGSGEWSLSEERKNVAIVSQAHDESKQVTMAETGEVGHRRAFNPLFDFCENILLFCVRIFF